MVGVRKLQAAETEAALKEAARRVFAREGYLNSKITDITTEAGRAAGSFYRHFTSKESLLEALLADMLDESDQAVVDNAGHSSDFTDPAAVRWHVEAYWRFFRAHRTEMVALHQAAMVDERFARRLKEMMTPDIRHMAAHLEFIRTAGRELPGDPFVVASAMGAMMWQFGMTWMAADSSDLGRELPDEEAVDTLTALILYGIAGQGQGQGRAQGQANGGRNAKE